MIEDVLLEYGYTKSQISNFLDKYLIKKTNKDTLERNIQEKLFFMEKIGYTRQQLIKMSLIFPSIYTYSTENISQKIKDLLIVGYTKEEILKMTSIIPAIYGYSIENIIKKINMLIDFGYKKESVLKMTIKLPAIFCYSKENIEKKINDLLIIGYTKENLLKMTSQFPQLYSYSTEYITEKINELISIGFTKKEVINITTELPTIFGITTEHIKEKLNYLKSIGLENIATTNPKKLMQSVELTYARYNYLTKEKNITIDEKTYSYLFYDAKRFFSQFGIDKKTILKLYNYDIEIKEKNETSKDDLYDRKTIKTKWV